MECWKAFSAFCQFDRIYNLTNCKIKKFLNLSGGTCLCTS
nr:MAG TPA: hypothetical protein [Caudoviricetes sp.]DAI11920.1 MAG TPA: hypothetical protein [Caudoviricetes sp.]